MRLQLLFTFALCANAGAQTYTELIREGDPVPGATSGELVASIDNVDVNRNGDWLIELNGDGPTTNDQYALHNGTIFWQEGTSLGFTAPAGKEASSFIDVMDINDSGDIMIITPLRDIGTTSTNSYLLVWNGVTVVEDEVTPCLAPSLPPGTIWDHVNEAWQNNNGQLLVTGTVHLGGSPLATNIMLRMDLDASGAIINEVKLALEGETLPGHATPIQGFSASKGRQAINDNGECMWYVDDEHSPSPPGNTLNDSNMFITDAAFNNNLLYNEADPFPTDPADVFDHFSTAEIDLNNNGDFVFSGFDRGPSSDDSWIFKSIGGVLTVLAHEGDPVPASIGGGWLTAGFGFGGVVPMSNSGDVLWYIDWDDPNTDSDTGLMFNDTLILQEGVSMLGGAILEDVPNSDSEIAMSDDGSFAILEVVLDGATDLDAVFLAGISTEIGTNYCGPPAPNSTGFPSTISASGSESAAANNLTLTVDGVPAGQFGYFLAGQTQGFFNPAGSQGFICLMGNIGRFNAVPDIISGPSGSIDVDLMAIPVNPPEMVMSGQTWNFQCWYRDNNPNLTSNFSDGISITFQ